MPITQNGAYYNIRLDPNESITVTKQYEGAGKISKNGSYRYSFIAADGNSASFFATPELSMELAPVLVGTHIILTKDEGQYGQISATLSDGSPLSQAPRAVPAPTVPAPAATPRNPAQEAGSQILEQIERQVPINRDHSIAWQNANNAASTIAAQVAGGIGEKMDAFRVAQETIFESFLGEFAEDVLKRRKLVKEANEMFDGEKK